MRRNAWPKLLSILVCIFILFSCKDGKKQTITILVTTDVHGYILPYDFIEKKNLDVSQANAYTCISKIRNSFPNTILLDNGDNLQGQPLVYYYNYIDTLSPHINAEVMNFMRYDAATVGNHDIEAGHRVYDRLAADYGFPLLAANAVEKATGKPYFNPFVIIQRNGFRIAVLGLVTSAIPDWLPPELYAGIEFKDMVETAKQWMPLIKQENPDLIIGLFHSGWDNRGSNEENGDNYEENGSVAVAREVPGFDIVFIGHDHRIVNEKTVNSEGDTILILDSGSRSEKIARADIVLKYANSEKKIRKLIKGEIIDVDKYTAHPDFMKKFGDKQPVIENFVNEVICTSEATITSRESYFGSSPFVDMIHLIQLKITDADISFAAPLSFDASIKAGPVTIGDMFKLYRFENMLYTMNMTGQEIKNYLEFSYAGWYKTMKGPNDNLLNFRLNKDGKPALNKGLAWLKNQPYNFDSAAGIEYIVDVSKPEGERVTIKALSDGTAFHLDKMYTVAVNSYRGNGGGGHFLNGAGISKKDLRQRLISSTERDLRYYIIEYLKLSGTIKPKAINNWKVIPSDWVKKAARKDYQLLFGK